MQGMSGNLNRTSLVHDSGELFRRYVFDALKTCRIQNPDIPRAGRVGAHGEVAGRGRAGLDANRTVRLGDKPPSYPPEHRRHVAWTSFQKREQAKSYVNLWRNKTRSWPPIYPWLITALSVSLCLDTQGEFALPARDYRVVARVTGWYDRLQQSRLAAPGCPACAFGWTPQAQGKCTFRLEARVARFHAARPALSGFRSSGRPSASVACSPPIGVTFPGTERLSWLSSFLRSVAHRRSHGNLVARRPQADILRNSYFWHEGFFLGQISCGSSLHCPHVSESCP